MLHLLGLAGSEASLPQVGSVRLIEADGVHLIVQEVPPDFASEGARALTEALLAEAWGTLCRMAERQTVLAFRFGQTLEDEAKAGDVCNEIGAAELLGHEDVEGAEEWTLTLTRAAKGGASSGGYLAQKSAARQGRMRLADDAQELFGSIDGPRRVSAPATEGDAVSLQLLIPRDDRDAILGRISEAAEGAGFDATATGPQPVLHFAPNRDEDAGDDGD